MDKESFKSITNSFTLNITNSNIDSMRSKETVRKSIRIIKNGKMGISGSKSDIDFSILEKNANDLCDIDIPEGFIFPKGDKRDWDIVKKTFSNEEVSDIAEKTLNGMKSAYHDFIFSNKITYSENSVELKNSRGIDYSTKSNQLDIVLLYKHKNSSSIMDGFWVNSYYEMPDIETYIKKAEPFLYMHENQLQYNKDKAVIVFPEFTGAMPFRFLTKHINGELIKQGASALSGKVNEKLFSDKFTLSDLNYDSNNGICSAFDGDGFRRDEVKLPIFENGIFKKPLYDLKRAILFNEEPTGTSYRPYNQSAARSPNALYTDSIDKSLKDFDEAIIVMISSGGDFQDNGDISLPVQLAFLVKNGKIEGKMPQMMLTGSIDNLFNNDYIGALQDGLFDNSISRYTAFEMNIHKG